MLVREDLAYSKLSVSCLPFMVSTSTLSDESGISELIGQEIGRLFEPLKADLDENAKLTEANAMDWGTAITEKVDLIEGNVMDKVLY